MCVCLSTIITCTKLHHSVTIATSIVEAIGSLQAKARQARLVLCYLDGERVVGNNDNSVLASFDC